MPHPSRCGPVAPPRRINPAKLKQISVGTLAFIPSNSHKLQFLLTAITLSMKHISIKAPQAEATGRVILVEDDYKRSRLHSRDPSNRHRTEIVNFIETTGWFTP